MGEQNRIFIIGPHSSRKIAGELANLFKRERPEDKVEFVLWPQSSLPWQHHPGRYCVIALATREGVEANDGWAHALTSRNVDAASTLVAYLGGLTPQGSDVPPPRSAELLQGYSVADISMEIAAHVERVLKQEPRSIQAWGPDESAIIGRETDVVTAVALLTRETRALAIVGLGGQGKTAFAAVLARKLFAAYDNFVWITLRRHTTLDWIAQNLAARLGANITSADATVETATGNILDILSAHRVLLVLDNAEVGFGPTVMPAGTNPVERQSQLDYLFRSVAESASNSLVLVTTRELPNSFRLFPNILRSFRLPGLSDEAVALLIKKSGVAASQSEVAAAQLRLLGNPLAVKLLCGRSIDSAGGSQSPAPLSDLSVNDTAGLVDEQLASLSPEERHLLAKLAWQGGRASAGRLDELAWPMDAGKAEVYVRRISRLFLVDVTQDSISVSHPLLREQLISDLASEFQGALLMGETMDALPTVLANALLVDPNAADDVRISQIETTEQILKSVVRGLGTRARVKRSIVALLGLARRQGNAGYAVANLVEAARQGSISLGALDLSGMTLESVDFRDIDLRGSNCSGAAFRSCVFADSFGPVTAVGHVGPDARQMASGTFEGNLRLWSSLGELQSVIRCADDWISAIRTWRDQLVVGSVDGTIRLVDQQTQVVREIVRVPAQIRSIACLPSTIVGGCSDGTIAIHDPATGRNTLEQVVSFRLKVALHVPGTESLILLAGDSGELVFYDTAAMKHVGSFRNGEAWVRDAVFQSSGKILYTADDDGRVRSWQLSTDCQLTAIAEAGHSHRVWCLALDESRGRLYSAGNDAVIRIWDQLSLTQIGLYEGHGSWIRSMALCHESKVLVTGGEDQTIRFWNTEQDTCFRRRTGYAPRIFTAMIADDGIILCGTGDHKLLKIKYKNEACEFDYLQAHKDQVFALSIDRKSNRVASASDDGEVRISDIGTGDSVLEERLHDGWIGAIGYSPSGLILATGSDDRSLALVDTITLRRQARRTTHEGRISALAFMSDDLLVSTAEDGTVRVHEAPGLNERFCHQLGSGPLYALGLLEGDRSCLAAGVGGKVWRVGLNRPGDAELVTTLPVNAIWSIDVNAETKVAALGLDDGSFALLNLATMKVSRHKTAHKRQVWSTRWSPDGSILVTASEDGSVALWDQNGRLLNRFSPPPIYAGIKISRAEGLLAAERSHLLTMGAEL